ncbi:two component system sensor kinase SsrA [Pedobacter glucosidilyticus]|uniref:Response regulator n=1 Tax=Pedobacter aquae TaxID=2605747 RepID=A0A5C0VK83_9SPHI|nr:MULTISPECIES: response regulator [Pedobacter]KHJ37589.1 two component system sensor kinase SsrA [Pedobacter glucosidilyticus]QEK52936.1 response regulator [Pedobacter aquae]
MPNYKYKTALLVDDNFIDNMINQKILNNSDFSEHIVVKQSCESAIQYLQELINRQEELPEIIFLDIRMPIKTGFDFLVEFQQLQSPAKDHVKIVMLSSSLDPSDHKKVTEFNNVTDFFGKPLTSDLLKDI